MMPNKQTPTSSSGSPTSRATTSKRATLTNWDGHFAIENAAALAKLCCAVDRSCCHKPLKAQNYNGYAATGTTTAAMTTRRSCSLPCASYSNTSDTDDSDDDGISATDNRLKLQRDALINLGSSIVAAKRNNADDAAGHSRLAHLTRQATIVGSSLIGDSMTEIVIDDLHNAEDEPTSAILSYCKKQ